VCSVNCMPTASLMLACPCAYLPPPLLQHHIRETLDTERRLSAEVRSLKDTIRAEAAEFDKTVLATNLRLEGLKEQLRKEQLAAAISTRWVFGVLGGEGSHGLACVGQCGGGAWCGV
jgi:hypothetical protein